ncbi:phage antirepressor KilAC domain-containing protein [Erwinia tracheiphila]|nr:phage antirepressor KilAC domain-containing protein [Erwinia tracheiphila]UIA81922.1 phage antirepressor KilAC domain-containing protein [Erwinia tracheiphila]UIA85248.1 phage antirepressor KilAC domain-containing protein [Erwinia tracheiphila]UIA90518.1 phage antirepressor KilAC domain-containing protein [Erwinia tracheiphila]
MQNLISQPVICGTEITTDDAGRFNLNALHKASGGKDAKRPKTWLETKQAQELISELRQNSALGQEVIKVTKGGTSPGTFAHELLAVEYAGWISPAFRLQVNQTFIDFRSGKLPPVTFDMADALNDPAFLRGTLLTYTEKVIALEHQVEEMKPHVEALERIAKSDGSVCITDVAKTLQIQPKKLFNWMQCNEWIYKRAGGKHWLGYQTKIKQQLLEHKVTVVAISDGTEKMIEQVLVTPKGLSKLSGALTITTAA